MKQLETNQYLLMLATLAVWVSGCATRDVNPPQARPNTGYVDFYTDAASDLAWLVERFDDGTQSFTSVFSEFEPSPGRALRLAFPPGQCRLRVTSQIHFVREPAPVSVEVKDGLITPVHVVLVPEGSGMMERRERRLGRSLAGSHGRNTKITTEETVIFRLSVEAEAPMPYQVKERTMYAH
jgi:hypothetical protein